MKYSAQQMYLIEPNKKCKIYLKLSEKFNEKKENMLLVDNSRKFCNNANKKQNRFFNFKKIINLGFRFASWYVCV